jgi:hypothetical protein
MTAAVHRFLVSPMDYGHEDQNYSWKVAEQRGYHQMNLNPLS